MIYVVYIQDGEGEVFEMMAFTTELLANKYIDYLEKNNHDFDDDDNCRIVTEQIELNPHYVGDCE